MRFRAGGDGYRTSMADKLDRYRSRRDFEVTSEPRGQRTDDPSRQPVFVIQKHDASRLHYDFRLEIDGVLKSWAVPKGPSIDPSVKRLAVPTEDHPMEFADFEGVIPEDEYGAGTVLVWDSGTFELLRDQEGTAVERLERGRLNFRLNGHKLRGGFALVRTGGGENAQWLLIKMKGEGADRRRKPLKQQPGSVLSGSDLDEIAEHGKKLE